MANNRNTWDNNVTFVLAMIGSAVGLANIWRYPYVLYSNGGGAFYIPYIVAIVVLAIPFLILEYSVGFNFKSSFAKGITNINPKFQFFGWFLPFVIFIMTIYYSVVIGWDGIYFILSFFKGWGPHPDVFLNADVLHSSTNLLNITNIVPIVAISTIVVWFLVWFISHRNLMNGLGRISKIFVPLLFVTLFIIVGYSLTLPGAELGLNELFLPDWSLIFDFKIWMAAFGQIFFSLSLGIGAAFTFASYTKNDIDIPKSTICVVLGNCIFENIAALGVFSILGYMAFNAGIPVSQIVSEGTGLIFIAYPTVFNILGLFALVLGPLFFLTVYVAGLTSMLSSFEVLSSSIQDKFDLSRSKATTILCLIGVVFAMIFATAPGDILITISDEFVNNISLVIAVFLESIIFAWMFNIQKIIGFVNERSAVNLGKIWVSLVKYVIPVLLIVIWVGGLAETILGGIDTQLIVLIVLAVISFAVAFVLTWLPEKSEDWLNAEERLSE